MIAYALGVIENLKKEYPLKIKMIINFFKIYHLFLCVSCMSRTHLNALLLFSYLIVFFVSISSSFYTTDESLLKVICYHYILLFCIAIFTHLAIIFYRICYDFMI